MSNLWGTGGREYPSLDAFKRALMRQGWAPPKVYFDPEYGAWVVRAYFEAREETLGNPILIYEGDPRFKREKWKARGSRVIPVLVEEAGSGEVVG